MSLVNTRMVGQIAVLEINSPPVNALSVQLRSDMLKALTTIAENTDVAALLLHCAGSTFICGADIREFDAEPLSPHLPEVIARLENFPVPVVALLHGHVLGGGLEVAAACHYRIADPQTNIGLPEVSLGVVPGAGGAQRMMRLVGVENAVQLATSGRAVKVTQPEYNAFCDALLSDTSFSHLEGLLALGLHWVELALQKGELVPRATANMALDQGEVDWEALTAKVARSAKSNPVPNKLLAQLQRDLCLSVQESESHTRHLFLELRQSLVAKALRHAFFLEKKLQAPRGKQPLRIDQVGVIGAGTMGGAIAICFADAGFKVVLLEQSEQALSAGLERIKVQYQGSCDKGRITQQQCDVRISLINGSCDYSDVADVDLVIEAAFESMEVKQSIFAKLDEVCKKSSILATNTSYLDINLIAQATARPESVVGMHFFSPANIMKLLEIVNADQTAPAVVEAMQQLAKKLRKQAVTVGVCFGFAANRMYSRYGREIQQMLLEGASVEQIDNAMLDFGMAMGPLAVLDLSGIDIGHNARAQYPQPEYDPGYFKVSTALVNAGRLGRKTGLGFYNYSTAKPTVDQEVVVLIKKVGDELGITQQHFNTESIQQRTFLAMISEAAQVIEEGIVSEKEAIDLIWLHGYGFPRDKGGPMFMAEQYGIASLQAKMEKMRELQGEKIWPSLELAQYINQD